MHIVRDKIIPKEHADQIFMVRSEQK